MELPSELSALQALRQLQVGYAQLDAVPAAVQALPHLTALSLEGNHIATLPAGRYLTGLRRLSLANNAFADPPECLTACSRCGRGSWGALAAARHLAARRPCKRSPLASTPRFVCSLRELELAGNAQLALDEAAAERLLADAPALERLTLPARPALPPAAAATHAAGLRALARRLGPGRLQLE